MDGERKWRSRGAAKYAAAEQGDPDPNNCMANLVAGSIFGKIKGALGLDRCRLFATGAAPITTDLLKYFGVLQSTSEYFGAPRSTSWLSSFHSRGLSLHFQNRDCIYTTFRNSTGLRVLR